MFEANSQSMSKLTKGGGVYCHRIKKNAILCLKTVIYTDMDLNFRDTGAFLSPSLINTYSISAGLEKKMWKLVFGFVLLGGRSNAFCFVRRDSQLSVFETCPPGVQQHLHAHHDSCALMSLTHCLLLTHTHTLTMPVCAPTHTHTQINIVQTIFVTQTC